MKKRFRDLSDEMKAAYGITEDAGDDSFVYCGACGRAMEQGDCLLDDAEGSLRCAFDDCAPEGNLAFQSLYGWDAYRLAHAHETFHWPEEPVPGECYERPGAGPGAC
jgi:hypothetical protein